MKRVLTMRCTRQHFLDDTLVQVQFGDPMHAQPSCNLYATPAEAASWDVGREYEITVNMQPAK